MAVNMQHSQIAMYLSVLYHQKEEHYQEAEIEKETEKQASVSKWVGNDKCNTLCQCQVSPILHKSVGILPRQRVRIGWVSSKALSVKFRFLGSGQIVSSQNLLLVTDQNSGTHDQNQNIFLI